MTSIGGVSPCVWRTNSYICASDGEFCVCCFPQTQNTLQASTLRCSARGHKSQVGGICQRKCDASASWLEHNCCNSTGSCAHVVPGQQPCALATSIAFGRTCTRDRMHTHMHGRMCAGQYVAPSLFTATVCVPRSHTWQLSAEDNKGVHNVSRPSTGIPTPKMCFASMGDAVYVGILDGRSTDVMSALGVLGGELSGV